jgi:hypothetical protein
VRGLIGLMTIWLALAVMASAQTSRVAGREALDVASLVKEASDNGRGNRLLSEYTYTVRLSERKTDKQGQVKETFEIYEAYIPTLKIVGQTHAVLLPVTEKGIPISAEKLEKERQKTAERLLKAEAESQKQNRQNATVGLGLSQSAIGVYFEMRLGFFVGVDTRLNIREILEACRFGAARPETIAGREVIALDYQPPLAEELEKDMRYVAQTAGTIWIDAQDKILVRAEGWPRGSDARAEKPVFYYEQMRLPDGYWLPRLAQFNGATHHSIFGKLDKDLTFEFSDYKRFGSEVKDVKLNKPETKQ